MIRTLLFLAALPACVSLCAAQALEVPKTNPQKLYMHYMPWFQTPDTLGGNNWGWHWTMNNQDPNVILPNGQRQIASHYYPQIGPYDSQDPDVIEYHLLLMKLSGVDGVLIDWYGVQGTNGDIGYLLDASDALVDKMDDFGMEFAVVLEDRFSANVSQAQANVAYLRDNYFNNPRYIRQGPGNDPLLLSFGPITFQQESQWTQILSQAGEDVDFLPLWFESGDAGVNADGEFSWVWEDESLDDYLARLANFYQVRVPFLNGQGKDVAGGSVFPGFDDFYVQGGVGEIVPFDIPHDNGHTLDATLSLAGQHGGAVDFLQLVTWNDFGEGTMFEPTVQTGYDYLVQLQQFSGTPFGESELEMVFQLYQARKAFEGDAAKQGVLDDVASLLAGLDFDSAQALLDEVNGVFTAKAGDLDGDGFVGVADLNVVLGNWNQNVTPGDWLLGDPTGDGFVGIADLGVVLGNWNTGTPPGGAVVPEPGSLILLTCGVALAGCRVRPRI